MRVTNLRGEGLKLVRATGEDNTREFPIIHGGRVMRNILSNFLKNQRGQTALVNMLILVCVGGVVITPLLGFMVMGLKSGQMHEELTEQLYAADSGVEDALFWIPELESGNSTGPWNWQVDHWTRDTYEMNDGSVDSTVEQVDTQTYKITSTASTDDTGNTTIESYVTTLRMDFSELLMSAISSAGDVTIQPNTVVSGNITLPPDGNLDPSDYDPENGEVNREELDWPTAGELSIFYSKHIEGLAPFPHDYIDIAGTATSIGPLYRNGTLNIYNTVGGANATLDGTVYVAGDPTVTYDLKMGTEKHDFTLDLNGQTIYCEGGIWVGGKCRITGSGCIIAAGEVFFEPNILAGTENDFVFIMSVTGETQINPSGDFYGSLAGDVNVQLQPGSTLSWTDPSDKDLNFPEGEVITALSILSWEIR